MSLISLKDVSVGYDDRQKYWIMSIWTYSRMILSV